MGMRETCSIEACDRVRYARAWCHQHYERARKTGDPGPAAIQRRVVGGGCAVDDCERPHEALGYCKLHYRRWQAHGDFVARKSGKPYAGRTAEQVRLHIAANVIITDSGCWEWQRSRTQAGGYSALGWCGITPGHRVSYTVHNGPIPDGLWVRHQCDNPPCVNPAHLILGTATDNNDDMDHRGRANRIGLGMAPKGERHYLAKLTDAQAEEIRASTGRGVDLATRYGVSQQTICDIRKGRKRRES